MRQNLTAVYYTSNSEKPAFEAKIRQSLLDAMGDLPLISVSQRPIDFGQNICVGEVGRSAQNVFRQMQIGVAAAKTRFVCPAESDILYPPEYFTFRPPRDDTFYLAMPLWVLFAQRGGGKVFCRKPHGSESSMVVSRDLLLNRLTAMLAKLDQWGDQDADGDKLPWMLDKRLTRRGHFQLSTGVVTFKTDQNLHRKTPHDVDSKTRELSGWGLARDLVGKYCG